MSEPFVFDPRREAYKTPYGAVSCGQTITFSCRPLVSEGFSHCSIVLFHEFSKIWQSVELNPVSSAEEGRLCFTGQLPAPAKPELSWYHFHLWRDDGSGCDLDKTGYRSDGGLDPWQLTTYLPNHTPAWFGEGMTYQIFPDRFCRTALPDPTGLVGNRWVHENWDDIPSWQPEPDGEIRNRDFFGGSLAGITEKLDILADLGVKTLYLCPIFEAASNHRYNTADYETIDPFLGTEADFRTLCEEAHRRDMKVMLDGVFNHTGSQSIYFNEDGFYPSLGAAQSKESPYYDWFNFKPWPHDYDSWWGIKTLPAVREESESYVDYIIDNENSIIRRWLRCGADGWRLDVADELPDWFIEKIRTAVVETDPNAFLLGEVWEDASNKISYDRRRSYIFGKGLHSVMNYPFRTAVMDFLRGGNAAAFKETMETLRENYPPDVYYSALNFLSTHDTPRILTMLGAEQKPETRGERAAFRLSPAQRALGISRVKLAALILFSFPGSPMVYYGDEAGMEGWEDPFNRGSYPWGGEDADLKARFTLLAALRKAHPALQRGAIRYLAAEGSLLVFARELDGETLICAVNAGETPEKLTLPWNGTATDLLSGTHLTAQDGVLTHYLPPRSGMLLL